MKKAVKSEKIIPAEVLQSMIPGERYTLYEIMARSGIGISSTRTSLLAHLLQGQVRSGVSNRRTVYWRPTGEELGLERLAAEQRAKAQSTLTGYDASIRQLQRLSVLTRPQPDSKKKI